jgi:ferrochelatase
LPRKKRVGIVLFQLGGPDSLEAVEPFLLNLFLDPDIIPLGPLGILRRPIAKLISSRRSKPVAGKYAEIGRRSPIATLTERQRVRLVEAVSPYIKPVAVTAMRYWHPMTPEAVDSLRKAGALDEIILLPLYPQYSYATTLSSLKEWRRVCGKPDGSRHPAVRQSARLSNFTITRFTSRHLSNASVRFCGNFQTARTSILFSARTGCP